MLLDLCQEAHKRPLPQPPRQWRKSGARAVDRVDFAAYKEQIVDAAELRYFRIMGRAENDFPMPDFDDLAVQIRFDFRRRQSFEPPDGTRQKRLYRRNSTKFGVAQNDPLRCHGIQATPYGAVWPACC